MQITLNLNDMMTIGRGVKAKMLDGRQLVLVVDISEEAVKNGQTSSTGNSWSVATTGAAFQTYMDDIAVQVNAYIPGKRKFDVLAKYGVKL